MSDKPEDFTNRERPRSRVLMWVMAVGGAGGLVAIQLLQWWMI
jgi:hypothetical protein